MRRKMLSFAAVVFAALASLLTPGCGGGTDLAFSNESGKPVITYSGYKAIAPVYNPGVPVEVIYGDGTLIRKHDPYTLLTSTIGEAQVAGILEELDEEGFFELEKSYANKEPLAGGTTQKLTVYLESGTHAVSVEGGAGPSGWGEMVATVIRVPLDPEDPDVQEYIPLSITLYARDAEQVPEGATVRDWPGDPADLAGAASATEGLVLEGGKSGVAWKAVQEAFDSSNGGDAYWSAGGKVYTYVYATPIIPGVKAGD